MRVAVLLPPRVADGRPDQDDTFYQAEEVTACLRNLGHTVVWTEYADHGERTMAAIHEVEPDVVVNLVEEVPEGPDQLHLVTAMLDRMGVRYTGSRTGALAALGDKRAMKARLAAAGLPTAPTLDDAPADASFIVKSALEHASLGLDVKSVVAGAEAARRLIAEQTRRFGGEWFAETYVEGREFDVSLLDGPDGPMVLPVAEVRFNAHSEGPRVFDYASKWLPDSAEAMATPRTFPPREEPLFSELDRLAVAAWHCFGLSGFAHVDFRVDREGRPFILEVNANPCIGHEAGVCEAAVKAGLTQADVVAALLAAA